MAPHPKATDLPALLAKLCDAGVEFIIVGGAACVIQGAPITTNDLDIVHRRHRRTLSGYSSSCCSWMRRCATTLRTGASARPRKC
jgi:hypothetical protein